MGIIGLIVVVIVSVHQLTVGHPGTAGIPAGDPLRRFVAPLALGPLAGDANVRPRCDPAHPNPVAINVCGQTKLAIAFVSPRSARCLREVDALQQVRGRFPQLQFAAVAVASAQRPVAQLVRRRGWTIPVAYDRDGAVGQLYGVVICPIVELADRGRIVERLIGERWVNDGVLAPHLQRLAVTP